MDDNMCSKAFLKNNDVLGRKKLRCKRYFVKSRYRGDMYLSALQLKPRETLNEVRIRVLVNVLYLRIQASVIYVRVYPQCVFNVHRGTN